VTEVEVVAEEMLRKVGESSMRLRRVEGSESDWTGVNPFSR
jgi:hypothetical protein